MKWWQKAANIRYWLNMILASLTWVEQPCRPYVHHTGIKSKSINYSNASAHTHTQFVCKNSANSVNIYFTKEHACIQLSVQMKLKHRIFNSLVFSFIFDYRELWKYPSNWWWWSVILLCYSMKNEILLFQDASTAFTTDPIWNKWPAIHSNTFTRSITILVKNITTFRGFQCVGLHI